MVIEIDRSAPQGISDAPALPATFTFLRSLESLKKCFESAALSHGPLSCVMVERSGEPGEGAAELSNVLESFVAQRRRRTSFEDQYPWDRTDRPWDVVLNDRSATPASMSEASRDSVYGDRTRECRLRAPTAATFDVFDRYCAEAGRLLAARPAAVTLKEATIAAAEADRWLWTVFDLALNPSEGSPLRTEWRVKATGVTMRVDDVDKERRRGLDDPVGLAALVIASSPPWQYCTLDDLFRASCQAIDRLVCDVQAGDPSRRSNSTSELRRAEPVERPSTGGRRQPTPNATEQAVMDYLYQQGIVGLDALKKIPPKKRPTGERLAPKVVGRSCDGQFKGTLSRMIGFDWLDNGTHHKAGPGYFLTQSGAALAKRRDSQD